MYYHHPSIFKRNDRKAQTALIGLFRLKTSCLGYSRNLSHRIVLF